MTSRLGMLLGLGALSACFLSPVPDTRTPEDRARQLGAKCRGATDHAMAALSSAPIDAVEPDVVYVPGGPNGREARFRGARIRLAPSAGTSHESVARALECHQADTTLGRVVGVENDPYSLPGRWLSIEVESAGDGFVVHVRADDADDARQVLARAKAFWLTRHALP